MRRAGMALALVLATATSASAARAQLPPPAREATPTEWTTSPEGHRFRVGFDPASRVWLGLAGAFERDGYPLTGVFEIDAGFGYRSRVSQGKGEELVAWQVDHRALAGWVQPIPRADGRPTLDATLYGIYMLRHDASPSVVLPTSPPVAFAFPFDIGFESETGRVTTLAYTPPAPGAATGLRVGVLRGALFLDPWRSGEPGKSFEIGVGARYDIDIVPARGSLAPVLIHRIAPMTAGSLRFRFQDKRGISVVDTRADVIPHFTSEGGWRVMALASAHVERTLIAINDQPFTAVLEGSYRYDPASAEAAAASDLRVSAGFALHFGLR
jgi:hypothetical protein